MASKVRTIVVVAFALVGATVLIIVGYRVGWTGFTGKTLWDWLQLLIIPLVLAVGALLFNLATTRTEQKIASDKQREDLLQTYLDRISELLLEKQLHSPTPPYEIRGVTRDEVRNVARVRTITILFQLDARRIGYVFAFLREAGLMSTTSESIVSLKQANLNKINFSQAVITEVDLRQADLRQAILNGATLRQADLSSATLREADLRQADLSSATLNGANLSYANLNGANLNGADLRQADLRQAILNGANLNYADLSGVDLSGADLSSAKVTEEQLKKATSLKGATMPNGSKHPW
jgi:uncharacterized protein YjbI with pentapeptide repeats